MNTAFMDEEILKEARKIAEARERMESQKNMEMESEASIYDEKVMIMGKPVRFERRKIDGIGISIMMPTDFDRISPELTRMIFPAGNPPTHYYGCGDIQFQIMMNHTNHKVKNEQIPEFLKLSEKMITTVGPRVTIVDRKNAEKEDLKIGILSFVSRALDTTAFNYHFYFSIDDTLIMGNIMFPSKYKKRFMKLVEEVVMSIEREEENEGDNLS